MQHLADGVLAAAVVLADRPPALALVWDERYGWRTVISRHHLIGKDADSAPEGEGIRYLSTGQQPESAAGSRPLALARSKRRSSQSPCAARG